MDINRKDNSLLRYALFCYPETKYEFATRMIFILLIYFLGAAFWIYFFNAGKLTLVAFDWIKENLYLDTLRKAQIKGVLPWNWNEPFYFKTKRFLANPEIILTPDIFLLPLISNGLFVILHVFIMYTIGFIGSVILAKKLRLSLITSVLFWVIFNFNGNIIAHLAVGHFQWTGYFLLPFFFIILFRLVSFSKNSPNLNIQLSLGMALLLFFLFLNGSIHIAIWCCIFMAITVIWKWSMFGNIAIAIVVGSLLGLGRLLPAAIWFHVGDESFMAGYKNLGHLFNAFANNSYHYNHYWEYDCYIGLFALVILIVGFLYALNYKRILSLSPILITALIFLIMSFFNVFQLFNKINLPFASIERIPSRFIVIPLVLLLIISVKGIDELFFAWSKISKIVTILVLPLIIIQLFINSNFWRLARLELLFKNVAIPERTIVNYFDRGYAQCVYISWGIAIIILSAVLIIYFRYHKRLNTASKYNKEKISDIYKDVLF